MCVRTTMGMQGGAVYVSTDAGQTWTSQAALPTTGAWQSVAAAADGSRLVAVEQGGNVWTYFSGTWTAQTAAGVRQWSAVDTSGDGATILAGVTGKRGGGLRGSGAECALRRWWWVVAHDEEVPGGR